VVGVEIARSPSLLYARARVPITTNCVGAWSSSGFPPCSSGNPQFCARNKGGDRKRWQQSFLERSFEESGRQALSVLIANAKSLVYVLAFAAILSPFCGAEPGLEDMESGSEKPKAQSSRKRTFPLNDGKTRHASVIPIPSGCPPAHCRSNRARRYRWRDGAVHKFRLKPEVLAKFRDRCPALVRFEPYRVNGQPVASRRPLQSSLSRAACDPALFYSLTPRSRFHLQVGDFVCRGQRPFTKIRIPARVPAGGENFKA